MDMGIPHIRVVLRFAQLALGIGVKQHLHKMRAFTGCQ